MSDEIISETIPENLTIPEKVDKVVEELHDNFVSDNIDLYHFNGKIYDLLNESEISQITEKCWRDHSWSNWTTRRGDEIRKSLIRKCYNKAIITLEIPGDWILFKNVIFDVKHRTTIEYTKEHFITKTLEFDYYPDDVSDFPTGFYEALKLTLPKIADRDKFLSYIQYTLTTSRKYQIAMILKGPTKTGKSSLIEFIMRLMGGKATSFELNTLNGNEGWHVKAGFKNITLAYASEIGGAYLRKDGMNLLKNLITETFQKGRKSYGKEIEWNSVTKFIFSANDLPNLQAKNGLDFFGRFDYIEFAHDFAKLGDRKYNVYDEIYDQEAGKVLSYIARYKGKYTFQPVAEDIRAWWLNDADSVYAWIKNCKIEEVKDANSAYAEYKNFCAIWKFEVFTYKYFKKCLSVYNVKTEKVIEGTDDDGEEPDSEEDGDLE